MHSCICLPVRVSEYLICNRWIVNLKAKMYGGGQQLNDIRNPHEEASEVRIQPKWQNPVWVSLEIFLEAKSRNTDCKNSFFLLTFFFSFICWKQPQLDVFHPTTCSTIFLCYVFCGKARKGKSNGGRGNNMDTWSWFILSARGRQVVNGHIQSYWELPREGQWQRNCTCVHVSYGGKPEHPEETHGETMQTPSLHLDTPLMRDWHVISLLDETGRAGPLLRWRIFPHRTSTEIIPINKERFFKSYFICL